MIELIFVPVLQRSIIDSLASFHQRKKTEQKYATHTYSSSLTLHISHAAHVIAYPKVFNVDYLHLRQIILINRNCVV